jgi:transcriptional regulator with XRE-family HTH domain
MPSTIAGLRAPHRLQEYASRAPSVAELPPPALIRTLRAALHMNQAQLARRAGIPQSHLARIETGKGDAQVGTLRKIFAALGCDLLFVPKAKKDLGAVLEEAIQEKARRNVARVAGTMTLEKQTPDDETLRSLIASEIRRLRQNPTSEIWAE